MGKFKLIEHPADIGIEIEAEDLKDLFENAARGMLSIMIHHPEKVELKEKRDIKIKGMDLKELLINFLSEFLYYIDAEGLIFKEYKIKTIKEEKEGEWHLEATLFGETFNREKHGSNIEIKAVTYHRLEIKKENEKWKARVIFDI